MGKKNISNGSCRDKMKWLKHFFIKSSRQCRQNEVNAAKPTIHTVHNFLQARML